MKWAKRRFRDQRRHAYHRGIEFRITFDEWNNWWLNNGVNKNYPPGKVDQSGNALCMCRFNDEGPYDLSNIYCATRSTNNSHVHRVGKEVTIDGIKYQTISHASRALGVSHYMIKKRSNPREHV